MKNVIIAFIFLTNGFLFSQNIDSLKLKQFYKEIDSITYTKVDFNNVKKHFTDNKKTLDLITKKASAGDKNASDLLEILSLTYDSAKKKFGERNIKILIYSHYKSLKTLEKFKKLESDFQKEIDSLNARNSFFEKEIEKNKKAIDSLYYWF